MTFSSRTGLATVIALLAVACAEEAPPPPESTVDTSRDLLEAVPEGGPSSPAGADMDLASRTNRAILSELGYNLGSVDAPLKVIEFADFGCGFCRLFHEQTLPFLLEEFVDTNQIEWKLLPFVSGQFENSLAITVGTECTLDQSNEAYQALAVRVWQGQSEWKPHATPATLVRDWAGDLGIDMDEYDACVAEERPIERIAGATAWARQLGITGTPTFWIVGYGPLQGALPVDVFRDVLTAVLEEVETAADSVGTAGAD